MSPPYQASPPVPVPPAKRGMPTWLIVLICFGAFFLFVVPILSVLAVYGVRKYIVNAKTAEARATLGQIAMLAAKTYDAKRGFCPSASSPVPADSASVSGLKYQSAPADWQTDRGAHAGFACLGFSMELPQYYQYSYAATGRTSFVATARGDLNGDEKFSMFTVRGHVSPGGAPEIGPRVEEESPEE